jgi:hypothetical protein
MRKAVGLWAGRFFIASELILYHESGSLTGRGYPDIFVLEAGVTPL